MNILISACLLGENCKYDGGNNLNKPLLNLLKWHSLYPVCPEMMGGLSVPRVPSERKGDRVLNKEGEDVTAQYIKGADLALKTAKENNCYIAILKARSPSCGKGVIYDGSFNRTTVFRDGVTAELLFKNGIEVYTEEEIDKIEERLSMRETTLCHIERDKEVLMLYRNRKKNDYNEGKWIGVGGKLEKGETPEECLKREVLEETDLKLLNFRKCGVVVFKQNDYSEIMHVYKSNEFFGKLKADSDEGELRWVEKENLQTLPMWEGDKIFIDIMESTDRFFKVELIYDGDNLIDHKVEISEEN